MLAPFPTKQSSIRVVDTLGSPGQGIGDWLENMEDRGHRVIIPRARRPPATPRQVGPASTANRKSTRARKRVRHSDAENDEGAMDDDDEDFVTRAAPRKFPRGAPSTRRASRAPTAPAPDPDPDPEPEPKPKPEPEPAASAVPLLAIPPAPSPIPVLPQPLLEPPKVPTPPPSPPSVPPNPPPPPQAPPELPSQPPREPTPPSPAPSVPIPTPPAPQLPPEPSPPPDPTPPWPHTTAAQPP